MGLMLSVLVMCVGVLEAISAVQHIRVSYLPLEFKRRKRRMVVDLGTGTVRHADISWPGDVPRGSHVIRRRSGLMSPHSSFDLPDEDSPRRTSVHFDPAQLERAVADILLEEDTTEESEDTYISPPVLESRLEFSTRLTTESAPINELRQETEPLPGNRPSLASRPDIVDPKTPAPRTDRPPEVPLAESDSVTFSEKIFTERFIHPIKESSPKHEFIPSDSTSSASSLSAITPQSVHTREQTETSISQPNSELLNEVDISCKTAFSENDASTFESQNADRSPTESQISNSSREIPSQDSPLLSPATSETAISSVTEISESVSTKGLLLDESTDKSEEDIPEDNSLNRVSVDRLESIEELIKSTNNLILRQDSEPQVPSVNEVPHITDETEPDVIVTENESAAVSPVSNQSTRELLVSETIPSTADFPVDVESTSVPINDSEVDESDNSVSSVVHAPFEENLSSDKPESTEGTPEPADLTPPVSPGTPNRYPRNIGVQEILAFPSEISKPLPKLPADESDTCELPGDAVKSLPSSVSSADLPDKKEEPALARGLSGESTISVESIEESSNTSNESQVLPRSPPLEESIVSDQDTEKYTKVLSISEKAVDDLKEEKADSARKINENEPLLELTKQDVLDAVRFVRGNEPLPANNLLSHSDVDSVPIALPQHKVAKSKMPSADNGRENTNAAQSHSSKCEQSEFSPISVQLPDDKFHSVPKEVQLADPNHTSNPYIIPVSAPEESRKSDVSKLPDFSNVEEPCPQSVESIDTNSTVCTANKVPVNTNDVVLKKRIVGSGNAALCTDETGESGHILNDCVPQSHKTQTVTVVGSEDSPAVNSSSQQPDEAQGAIISNTEHELNVKKSDSVKRKSLIETENIVVSAHHIESDEHVSTQQASQSDLAHSATVVECEGTSNVLLKHDSASQRQISPGDGKVVEEEGSTAETEDNYIIEDDESNQVIIEETSYASATAMSSSKENVPTFESNATTVQTSAPSCRVYEAETPNTAEKAKPVAPVQRNNRKQIVETFSNVTRNVIMIETPSEKDDDMTKSKSNKNPIATVQSTANTYEETKPVVPIQKNEPKQSVETSGDVAGNGITTDTPSDRGDGPKKSNSNENPTATDRSNVSEVKQEVKRVSSIEESVEIVKVAPSVPAEPQMEDIPVPTADTSPNKAFWLIFSGEYTRAMNKDWHTGHFSCWQCDESLTGQRYVLRDDHPYCIKCYESVFANTCDECNKIIGIDSKDLSYKDKHWHEACFACSKCHVSLVDRQFGSKADKIYCGNCFDAQFAARCDGCTQIFRAGTKKMEYKSRQWHEQCFVCVVCKSPIGTKSFIPREQEIFCAPCYEEKFATRCVKCNKIITSGGVTYRNEPWHRECFTCTNCTTPLAGQRFTSRDEKPYCADCFGELFAKRCTACTKPITGIGGTRFISFEDRHWHNDCFICSTCKTSLVGRGFITDAEDILCTECAKQKLM